MAPIFGAQQSQWKQWLAALAASSLLLSSTVDTVWGNRFEWPLMVAPTFYSMHEIVISLGAILGAVLADTFGRKRTLLVTSLFVIPRIAGLNFVSADYSSINQFFMDIGSGITCTVVPIYIAEISDSNNRGKLMVLQLLVFTLGVFIVKSAAFLGLHKEIGIINTALLVVSTLFHAITLRIFPETPEYLNWKKRHEEAGKSLAFFRGVEHVEVTTGEPGISLSRQVNNEGHGWWQRLREISLFDNRRNLALIFSLIAFKWASGNRINELHLMTMVLLYGDGNHTVFPAVIVMAASLIFSGCLMFIIGKFGQRRWLLYLISASFISVVISVLVLPRFSVIFMVAAFEQHLAHLIFVGVALFYTGEFFPTNVRAIAIAAITIFEVLTRFGITLIENGMLIASRSVFPAPIIIILNGIVLFSAFLVVLIFFTNTNKVVCSEITIKTTASEQI